MLTLITANKEGYRVRASWEAFLLLLSTSFIIPNSGVLKVKEAASSIERIK